MSGSIQTGAVLTSAEGPLTLLCRWAARVLSVGLLLLVLAYAVFEGVPNPFLVTWAENLTNGAFLLLCAGLYLGLRYERAGGVMALLGYIAFTAANYPITNSFWPGRVYALFALAGVLYLIGRKKQPERRGV